MSTASSSSSSSASAVACSCGSASAGGSSVSGGEVNVIGVAAMELMRMIHGDWLSQLIFVAAKLKLPDILQAAESSPVTTAELAAKVRLTPKEAAALLTLRKHDEPANTMNGAESDAAIHGNGGVSVIHNENGVEGVSVDVLEAVLKSLRMMKVVEKVADGRWKNGPLGVLLTTSHPASLRNWAILNGELYGKFFTHLFSCLVTGMPATREVLGDDDFYRGLDNFPQLSSHFDKSMNEMSRAAAMCVPKNVKPQFWMPVKTVVDIGGGNGGFVRALLRAIAVGKDTVAQMLAAKSAAGSNGNSTNQSAAASEGGAPHSAAASGAANVPPLGVHLKHHSLSAVVVDRASTCDAARRLPENLAVAEHIQFAGADLFDALPPAANGADWYVIKNVLHDYSDTTCKKILENIRRTMTAATAPASTSSSASTGGSSPLLVIERLLDEDEQRPGLVLDAVFARLKGEAGTVDRSESMMRKLLEQSGFRCDITVALPTAHTIIIAYPN